MKRKRFGKQKILIRDNYVCQYCGNNTTGIDHIIPFSSGGDNKETNLVTCCHLCNSIAYNKNFYDFIDKKNYILDKLLKRKIRSNFTFFSASKLFKSKSIKIYDLICERCNKFFKDENKNNRFCEECLRFIVQSHGWEDYYRKYPERYPEINLLKANKKRFHDKA